MVQFRSIRISGPLSSKHVELSMDSGHSIRILDLKSVLPDLFLANVMNKGPVFTMVVQNQLTGLSIN